MIHINAGVRELKRQIDTKSKIKCQFIITKFLLLDVEHNI